MRERLGDALDHGALKRLTHLVKGWDLLQSVALRPFIEQEPDCWLKVALWQPVATESAGEHSRLCLSHAEMRSWRQTVFPIPAAVSSRISRSDAADRHSRRPRIHSIRRNFRCRNRHSGKQDFRVGPRGKVELPRGAREISTQGKTVVPGFVDVHIHGAGGHDVMEGTPEALEIIAATVARHGTTSLVATTVTASEIETCESVAGIARFILEPSQFPARELAAEIVGIHFEGPFISPARRGVHPAEWIVAPSHGCSVECFLTEARGTAQILTLAPELPGALGIDCGGPRGGLGGIAGSHRRHLRTGPGGD